MRVVALASLPMLGLLSCASDPPPRPAEPAPPPLEIPPLPPQKEAQSRPTTHEAPPVAAPEGEQPLSVPGPLALPCSNDGQCGLHRCNMQFRKCAFPCSTDHDCMVGSACFGQATMAVCVPKTPAAP